MFWIQHREPSYEVGSKFPFTACLSKRRDGPPSWPAGCGIKHTPCQKRVFVLFFVLMQSWIASSEKGDTWSVDAAYDSSLSLLYTVRDWRCTLMMVHMYYWIPRTVLAVLVSLLWCYFAILGAALLICNWIIPTAIRWPKDLRSLDTMLSSWLITKGPASCRS